MRPMPINLDYKLDPDTWGDSLDPTATDLTQPMLHSYVQRMILSYQGSYVEGLQLWEEFRDDFQGWTQELFAMLDRKAAKALRDHLVLRDVWIEKPRGGRSWAQCFMTLLEEDERAEWTQERWDERAPMLQALNTAMQASRQQTTNASGATPTTNNPQPTPETSSLPKQTAHLSGLVYGGGFVPPGATVQPTHQTTAQLRGMVSQFEGSIPPGATPQPTAQQPLPNQQPLLELQANDQFAIPGQTESGPTPAKLLTELLKVYNSEAMKYGSEEYDILDQKLQVFYDCCNKIGISQDHYHAAFSTMLKGRASNFYYDKLSGRGYDFNTLVSMTRTHFETEEKRQKYLSEWREINLLRTISENPDKSRLECFQAMIDKLQVVQRGLPREYQHDHILRDQVVNACRGVDECNLSLYKPAPTFEGLCADMRSAIGTAVRSQQARSAYHTKSAQAFNTNIQNEELGDHYDFDQNWTDRTYGGRGRGHGRSFGNRGKPGSRGNFRGGQQPRFQKKCYVCKNPGCFSTKHTPDERKRAYVDYRRQQQASYVADDITQEEYGTFLISYEGLEGLEGLDDFELTEQFMTLKIEKSPFEQGEHFLTEWGEINGPQAVSILNDHSAYHVFTKCDPFEHSAFLKPGGGNETDSSESTDEPGSRGIEEEHATFTLDRYSSDEFHGIMPDSGAAGISSAGEQQVMALRKKDPTAEIDTSTAGNNTIRFGKGTAIVKGVVRINTPIGYITFHVVPTNTPFLLCLQDMDALGVQFDNLKNVLIQGNRTIPIVRKWGHPWMLLNKPEETLAWSHLTESELRQLHRRFGHPSVQRLVNVLQRAGHDVDTALLKAITKYCEQCQMHEKAPGRFKFTLKDDHEFNYSVYVDIMYLDGKPTLQVVDSATNFEAARFVKDMSTREVWNALRACWIDVYLGPPDVVVHDAGKNFASTEFKQLAGSLSIQVKEVPVEAHNSVGKVERCHATLRRAYEIIKEELKDESIDKEIVLQMAVKAINDTAGPDGIVPTLLVFGAYPRMTEMDPPSPSVAVRAEAIRMAMKEVRKLHAKRQVNDALAMRNGPSTLTTLNLPLQSEVRVWREKDGWQGPYKLLAIDGETCTIDMPRGPTNFRSTVVKPFYREQIEEQEPVVTHEPGSPGDRYENQPPNQPRGRGRPKGSRNKPRPNQHIRHSDRQSTNTSQGTDDDQFIAAATSEGKIFRAFMTRKEHADMDLALELRKRGTINTPGRPFEKAQQQEIEGLIARGVFEFMKYDYVKHSGVRLFNSRLVNEVKGKSTDKPYEKSRLVIQAYNDEGKELILTQSPTIQRASQRVLLAITPSLARQGIKLYLRDVTQAYIQSTTMLNRLILAKLPKEMCDKFPEGTIMVVRKPLYGIPEAGTHWWATYYKHHKEKLSMVTSTYDPCLLISTNKYAFGVVGMQTDDTLFLASPEFAALEDSELQKAQLTAKPRDQLTTEVKLMFNGCILSMDSNDTLHIVQKDQGKKLKLATETGDGLQQEYLEQRARGAYIASICQPEALFDLSVAAQHKNPTAAEVRTLNKRLDWQMKNLDRGIKYIPLDLQHAKLFVFVDGSFANNEDLSSQIGYLIILANESVGDNEFKVTGNLIHYSSIKSKRVTRSVLASEIYGMVGGVDMAIAINTTIQMITEQLTLPKTSIVVCTDSYSLYECLVKLGTTREKRLMIDIMALRQSYERREIMEIRWIKGDDNPADAMTKSSPNRSLEQFVDTNQLTVRVDGWVERAETTE